MRLPDPEPKRVFICSRYVGDIERNVRIAIALCRMAIEAGYAPFAPHLIYTRLFDDNVPHERKKGIALGLIYMNICDEVWVYTVDGISEGMKEEISHALMLGKPIVEIQEVRL